MRYYVLKILLPFPWFLGPPYNTIGEHLALGGVIEPGKRQ
jgi:hypothetical protein